MDRDVHRCTGTVIAEGDGADDVITTRGRAKLLLPSKTTGAVVLPISDANPRRRGAQEVSRASSKIGEERRRLNGEWTNA